MHADSLHHRLPCRPHVVAANVPFHLTTAIHAVYTGRGRGAGQIVRQAGLLGPADVRRWGLGLLLDPREIYSARGEETPRARAAST